MQSDNRTLILLETTILPRLSLHIFHSNRLHCLLFNFFLSLLFCSSASSLSAQGDTAVRTAKDPFCLSVWLSLFLCLFISLLSTFLPLCLPFILPFPFPFFLFLTFLEFLNVDVKYWIPFQVTERNIRSIFREQIQKHHLCIFYERNNHPIYLTNYSHYVNDYVFLFHLLFYSKHLPLNLKTKSCSLILPSLYFITINLP